MKAERLKFGAHQLQLDRPFLIVSSASSGSTLLSVLLDRHPLIACGPELSIFNKSRFYQHFDVVRDRLGQWIERGLSTDGQAEYRDFFFNLNSYYWDTETLVELANDSSNHREFLDQFFAAYLQKRGKIIWGEKTGSNAYCVEQFLSLYPDARVVHLVRDGRDVVCSLMGRSDSPYHAVSHWLYNVSACVALRGKRSYLEVRYEDLVSNPNRELERICSHIGVEFDSRMLANNSDGYWKRAAHANVHKSWQQDPFSGRISRASVGKYRTDLSTDVDRLFWRLRLSPFSRRRLKVSHRGVADLMVLLGYVEAPPTTIPRLSLRNYRAVIAEGLSRSKREFRMERRIWLPLTWVGW